MANLDKASIKDEVGRLKADFDRLGKEGKVTSESQAIMNSLFMITELILAIFLARSTDKNSKISSKPSSQTDEDESALGHVGSNGKGKRENKTQASQSTEMLPEYFNARRKRTVDHSTEAQRKTLQTC